MFGLGARAHGGGGVWCTRDGKLQVKEQKAASLLG